MRKTLFIVFFCLTFIFSHAQTTHPKGPQSQAKKAPEAPTKRPSSTKPASETKPVETQSSVLAPEKPTESTSQSPSSTTVVQTQAPAAQTPTLQQPASSTTPMKSTLTTSSTTKPAPPVHRDSYNGRGFSVGLRGGANVLLNKLSTGPQSSIGEFKRVPGFTAGVVLNYGFGSLFSVQPEILYTRSSLKYAGTFTGQVFSFQVDGNSVEIPILLKLSFGERIRFFVNAGPYVSYAMNSKITFAVLGLPTEKRTYEPDKNTDGRLTYGATGGLGISIPAGLGIFLLEGRYTYGLGTDAKKQLVDYEGPQIATVSLGYLFRLGR